MVQAMVLSFGGLRFSNQHLELNIHPKNLHRDLDFRLVPFHITYVYYDTISFIQQHGCHLLFIRRLSYGNSTHVNISVVVQEDNHAVLYVALDRSDKNYYACDGGCLDKPVQLG